MKQSTASHISIVAKVVSPTAYTPSNPGYPASSSVSQTRTRRQRQELLYQCNHWLEACFASHSVRGCIQNNQILISFRPTTLLLAADDLAQSVISTISLMKSYKDAFIHLYKLISIFLTLWAQFILSATFEKLLQEQQWGLLKQWPVGYKCWENEGPGQWQSHWRLHTQSQHRHTVLLWRCLTVSASFFLCLLLGI